MKKLIFALLFIVIFSSCYDLKERSLQRSADYQEQQVEQLKRLCRMDSGYLYNYNN